MSGAQVQVQPGSLAPASTRTPRPSRRVGWAERRLQAILARADIRTHGERPWDLRVHDPRLFRRVVLRGPVGLGDAYVDGWWDCDALDELFCRALRADLPGAARWCPDVVLTCLAERLFNLQTRRRAFRNGRHHYNRGNDLFRAMLDPRLVYSCGYWKNARTLEEAQEAKLDLICRKLGLRPGMSLLDIGCGWGGLCRFAAERYGARVVGITVSDEQARHAAEACRGLPVQIRVQDYRDVRETFDRVASVGMFEHVGPKNYDAYMRAVERAMAPDGLALIHFFAGQRSFPNTRDSEVNWITRHIFPGAVIPSLGQVGRAVEGRFVLEDLHNFGADYDPTLMAWHANFVRAWPALRGPGRDERFFRTWTYYLLSAAGAFRARKYQLWQLVLSRRGVPGGYTPVR